MLQYAPPHFKQPNLMKVYAVVGGYKFEGEYFPSLKLFHNDTDALTYRQELLEGEFCFDSAKMVELEVY